MAESERYADRRESGCSYLICRIIIPMKQLCITLVVVFTTLFASSCKAEKKEGEQSLLWRITGRGLTKPSYLFGTIHMVCPGDYLWTDAMKKGLAACKKVCFEMDMDD